MNATTILLEPLPGDATTELLGNLLGEHDLPATARDRILAAADGNPLFVEEMVGMLIDDGLLRFDGQMWRAAEDLADLTVPPTIQLLLAARLDRLDAEERAVMERGCGRRQGVPRRRRDLARARRAPRAGSPEAAHAGAQGTDPSRPGGVRRRGRVPVPASVDP